MLLVDSAIRRQPLQSTFTPKPALFISTKRTCRVKLVVVVRPDDAGAQLVDHLEKLAAFVRPYPRAQVVGDVVRAIERLLRRAKGHHAQDRPGNPHQKPAAAYREQARP